MGLSNRLLLGGAAGAAVLALVGVGAGASFTDSATAGANVTTGDVGVHIRPWEAGSSGGLQATYVSEGTTSNWGIDHLVTDTVPGSGMFGSTNGFVMTTLSNMGSDFSADIPLNVVNGGSLPLHHFNLKVDNSGSSSPLDDNTTVTVKYGSTVIASHSLTAWAGGQNFDYNLPATTDPTKPSQITLDVQITGPSGGYTNAEADSTMAPTFTLTASDN